MTLVLYKYMEERHARSMLSHGEVRLGTLYEFRDEERLGSVRGDRDEGAINLRKSGFTVIDTAIPGGVPAFLQDKIRVTGGARVQIVSSDGIGRRHEDADCWVYCTTDRYDEEQMKEFNCDTCIEIFDIEPFFFAISRAIQDRIARFWGAAKCMYRDRAIEHTDYRQIPPAFIKAPRHAPQSEVRGVWIPKSAESLTSTIVVVPDLPRFCRLFGTRVP